MVDIPVEGIGTSRGFGYISLVLGNKGVIKRKDGTAVYLTCAKCKNSKKLSCHQNCKEKQQKPQPPQGGGVSAAGGPPVELGNDGPAGASITELRTEMSILVNPNSLGNAIV